MARRERWREGGGGEEVAARSAFRGRGGQKKEVKRSGEKGKSGFDEALDNFDLLELSVRFVSDLLENIDFFLFLDLLDLVGLLVH